MCAAQRRSPSAGGSRRDTGHDALLSYVLLSSIIYPLDPKMPNRGFPLAQNATLAVVMADASDLDEVSKVSKNGRLDAPQDAPRGGGAASYGGSPPNHRISGT